MKLLRHLSFFFAVVFSVSSAGSASAHPHVWVTMETEVEMGDTKEILAACRTEFTERVAIGDAVRRSRDVRPCTGA